MRTDIMRCMLACSLAFGCTRGEGVASTALQVELDAYSGRPNPVWTLTEAETDDVLRRLRGIPRVTGILPPDGLGYRASS